jgi:hypothetical protein
LGAFGSVLQQTTRESTLLPLPFCLSLHHVQRIPLSLRRRFVPVGPCSRTTSRLCAMARSCQCTPAQQIAYVSFNYFPIQFPPQYWLCSNRQGAFAIIVPTSHEMHWVPKQRHGGWVCVEGRCNASTASRCVASTYAGEHWTTSTRLTHVDETKHSIPRRRRASRDRLCPRTVLAVASKRSRPRARLRYGSYTSLPVIHSPPGRQDRPETVPLLAAPGGTSTTRLKGTQTLTTGRTLQSGIRTCLERTKAGAPSAPSLHSFSAPADSSRSPTHTQLGPRGVGARPRGLGQRHARLHRSGAPPIVP